MKESGATKPANNIANQRDTLVCSGIPFTVVGANQSTQLYQSNVGRKMCTGIVYRGGAIYRGGVTNIVLGPHVGPKCSGIYGRA